MNDLLNMYKLSSILKTMAVTPARTWSCHIHDKPSILPTLSEALTLLSHLLETLTASKRQSFSRNSNLKTCILSPHCLLAAAQSVNSRAEVFIITRWHYCYGAEKNEGFICEMCCN
jgi:hypothetical protein